ncbi:N-acetylglucosaminyl deacetylase, LmbE family [Pseudomonas cuatrocienegasensis]|uniref:N-acetylglucosaminyl deacetylase, LmbE family n=1 Tax=Pseudomonas cuatrocienegasensis TaxID=543360 RepID=A0ABY1BMV0_9PSED|nr:MULTISPECIES: PIG-L family deacetylase [Pseudomonas]OEC32732.1 acetylglucosaminylphosphatidylinositol deacetylase [Pseudomonas sp. 21C1]SER21347.1 N-acetylglucosaminyl deacetylase, LmbE family [Pseudomonas cuatrocienegasensis]
MSQAHNPIQGQGTPSEAWQRSAQLARVPLITASELLPPGSHVVVVAPHPDDEVLACGGLLAQIAWQDVRVSMVAVTDGEASHPHSAVWPTQLLRRERPRESQLALRRLGFSPQDVHWTRLRLDDSQVARDEAYLLDALVQCIADATHVISTWRHDGHCDHEAVGRACAAAVQHQGCQLYEVPVWAWHWAAPEDDRLPWARARKLLLDNDALGRKQAAIHAHRSQLLADASTGAEPVLTPTTLARFAQPYEVFFL